MKHEDHEESRAHQGPAGLERLASVIVDAGLKVHRTLGPGLLEAPSLGDRGRGGVVARATEATTLPWALSVVDLLKHNW